MSSINFLIQGWFLHYWRWTFCRCNPDGKVLLRTVSSFFCRTLRGWILTKNCVKKRIEKVILGIKPSQNRIKHVQKCCAQRPSWSCYALARGRWSLGASTGSGCRGLSVACFLWEENGGKKTSGGKKDGKTLAVKAITAVIFTVEVLLRLWTCAPLSHDTVLVIASVI